MIESEENGIVEISDNILRTPDLEYTPQGGLGHEYFRMMKVFSDKIVQLDAATGIEETYATLLKKCIRTSLKMQSQGIKEGDIVTLCTYNHINSIVPFIAATFLGCKVASLDPTLSLDDTSHLLKQVPPQIIFFVPESIDLITKAVEEAGCSAILVVFGESSEYQQFDSYLEECEGEDDFVSVITDPEETAVIFFSSGTTGLPKGICQKSYALLAQGLVTINNGFCYMGSVTLIFSSLYWISSALFLTAIILSGSTRLVARAFNPKTIWNLIEKYKVTSLFLAPIQAVELYKAGRPDGVDTSCLESIIIGGGVVSKTQMEQIRDIVPGTFVSVAYGQTEVAGVLSCFKPRFVKDTLLSHYKPTSCGRPIQGLNYKIVDPETEEILGPNKSGELRVKTRYVMTGYYNLDSSDCFDDDGWLKTGDIAYYDEDLCFFVVDRLKEMLKYKSWHIPPAVLENVVKTHPAVKQVVVIGIPDEDDGDHAMAVVVLYDHYKDKVTEDEILEFANSKVPERQKLYGGLKFTESLPITPSGKVKRQLLRNLILSS